MRKGSALGAAAGAFVLAQVVPLERSNPPVEVEVPAPGPVRQILERSCYDCHSHATRWPWYAWVAPVSWLVVHDVNHACEHLNFSAWNRYDAKERSEKLDDLWEEVEKGEMPLWYYLPLHPQARLSEGDKQTLHGWALAPPG